MNVTDRRKITLEIGCCGDCPYYNWKPKQTSKRGCMKGANAAIGNGHFFEDCPLEFSVIEKEAGDA